MDLRQRALAAHHAPWRHEDGAMHAGVHVHDHLSSCSTV
jgi:hypothetical protein